MKRAILLLAAALAVVLVVAACGGTKKKAASSTGTGCAVSQLNLKKSGTLTIGTDNPAYPPWYGGSAGHGWKISDPYSGKGYESAAAYALAKQLGFARAKVTWKYVSFDSAKAPGNSRRE